MGAGKSFRQWENANKIKLQLGRVLPFEGLVLCCMSQAELRKKLSYS